MHNNLIYTLHTCEYWCFINCHCSHHLVLNRLHTVQIQPSFAFGKVRKFAQFNMLSSVWFNFTVTKHSFYNYTETNSTWSTVQIIWYGTPWKNKLVCPEQSPVTLMLSAHTLHTLRKAEWLNIPWLESLMIRCLVMEWNCMADNPHKQVKNLM